MNAPRLLKLAAAAALILGVGCDDHDDHDSHDSHGDESGDADVDEYSAGLTKDSEAGHFSVELTSEPGPPVKGVNTWTLMVLGHGSAAEGAEVEVTPYMTEHGHGSNSEAVVTDDGAGQYTVTPVDLHMAGVWDTTIAITHGGMSDEVHFVFEIEEI